MSSVFRSRKGSTVMLPFVVSILIGLLLVGSITGIGYRLFAENDQAEESFVEFAEKINEASLAGEGTSSIVHLDRDSFIIAYNAGKDTSICTGGVDGSVYACGPSNYPSSDENCAGDACICLCSDYYTRSVVEGDSDDEVLVCEQRQCLGTPGVIYTDNLALENFYLDESVVVPNIATGHFDQGFIITRDVLNPSFFAFPFMDFGRQFFTITYVEGVEGGAEIAVCRNDPCVIFGEETVFEEEQEERILEGEQEEEAALLS